MTWFETVTSIASGVLTLTLLALVIVLAPAAMSFWRTFRRVEAMLNQISGGLAPVARHAANIADNLDYITTSIRHDVQQVNATIASANRKLQRATAVTERRLNEFNALLEVVQQEAEDAFVSTASMVRGVRGGAVALRRRNGKPSRVGDDEELPDAPDVDDHGDEGEEDNDAHEHEIEAGPRRGARSSTDDWHGDEDAERSPGEPARPRVRPARRRHR